MKRLLLPLFLSFGFCLAAQTPDCSQVYVFHGIGRAPSVQANTGNGQGCATWQVTFQVNGPTAVSIQLDGSNNNSTFAVLNSALSIDGTSNPISWTTSTTQARIAARTYFPWVAVEVTSVTGTGTVTALLLGYKGSSPALPGTIAVTVSPSGTQDVNLIKVGGAAITEGQKAMAASLPVVLPSDQSAIPVTSTSAANTAVLAGQQAVTGTAVALATHTAKNVCVKANLANTINVYLGPTGTTTSTGLELTPGAGTCLPISNTNLIFVVASTTGATVSWISSN